MMSPCQSSPTPVILSGAWEIGDFMRLALCALALGAFGCVSVGCTTAEPVVRPGGAVVVAPGLEDRSPHAEAALDRAQGLLDRGRPDLALPQLHYALRLDARLYRAHYLLGHCYYELGEYELEASEYAKCLAINPDYPSALVALGHCSLSLDRLEDARDAYARYLELRPRDGRVLYNLAQVQQDLGDEAASRALFRRLAKLESRSE